MLEPTSHKNAIIAAALRLAEQNKWREVTLLAIAGEAGLTLLALKELFADKSAIVAAFSQAVDDEVLSRANRPQAGEAARDVLFEVVMTRLDALGPYKPAIRSIAAGSSFDPAHIRPLLVSQQWMLEAAGVSTGGLEGAAKVLGLASVYASVFRVWLEDDDPGLARTMAALDRRLRRGERAIRRVDEVCTALGRMASVLRREPKPSGEGGPPRASGSGAETGPAV
jgi:AcrR family transcriptional regulator